MDRRLIRACALILCSLFALTACAPRLLAALTPDQEAIAERLILDFGAREFAVRQEAVQKLVAMGPDVAPLVKKTLAEATDAEVKMRCAMVLKALAPRPVARALVEKKLADIGPTVMGWNIEYRRTLDGSALAYRFKRGNLRCHREISRS